MEKLWFVPVMAKADAQKNLQPISGHVVARAEFSFQAINVAGDGGYVAGSGEIREATEAERRSALAVLPEPLHAEDVPPIPFGATDHG